MNERGTKRRPLKGAVLFTILCVMAVILIMMLVTIGLSSVASRRAYSEYYDAQINATGRSVISSVLKSLDPVSGTNKDLGKTIYQQVGSTGSYEVHLSNGGNLGQGLGRVDKIVFEKAGVDSGSDFFVTGSDYMIMKVSATITMGNKTTTYTEYVSDMAHVPGKSGGNGGLLSTSGASSTGTGMTVLGPFGGGFKDYKRAHDSSYMLTLGNVGAFVGQAFFNDSVKVNTYKTFVFTTNTPASSYDIAAISGADYQGISILGDFKVENNSVPFVSTASAANTQATPYIFCTGTFDATGTTLVGIGSVTMTNDANNSVKGTEGGSFSDFVKKTSGNKVNLYCGSFKFPNQNSFNIASDIYCYNETQTSILGGGMNDSPLTNWIEQQVNGGTVVAGNCLIGNIYTKGNLALSKTKIGIKGNVYVNGTLDLSEIIGEITSGRVPSVDGGKIYCSSVTPNDYATVAGAPASYTDLVSKIEIVAGNKFPADMELDQILGITFTNGASTGSAQLSAIDNAQYTLNTGTDFTKKIIQSPLEMHEKFYMEDPSDTSSPKRKILRNSYNQSGVAPGADIYENDNVPTSITEQCTLKGTFNGKTITITPKPKADNSPLWILLDDASFYGTEIIVENIVKNSSNVDVEAGPVCFYIKDGTNFYFGNGSRLLTKEYSKYYTGLKLTSDISIKNGANPPELIPNIYIYGSNREDQGNLETIKIQNGAIITAYIVAPRANFEAWNMADSSVAKVFYEGVEYDAQDQKDVKVGIIGSAIVGPITQAANDIGVLYVDNSGGGTPTPPRDLFKYQALPGFTNY